MMADLILYCHGVRGVTWAVSELEVDNGVLGLGY